MLRHAPPSRVPALRCGAAAAAQWASRGLQPVARRGGLLLSRGCAALRRSAPAAAAAMASSGYPEESSVVVHVTGLRLFGDEARTDARGVAPAASAAAVLRAAAAEKPAPAAVIITGDTAADRSDAAYALAKRLVRAAFPAPTRVLFLPGPGDDAAALAKAFRPEFTGPGAGDTAPLCVTLPGGPADSQQRWRAVLLPPGAGAGAAAAEALRKELVDASRNDVDDPHVLLLLPAPLRPTAGFGGYDEDTCTAGPTDPDALVALVDGHSCVRIVLHGGAPVGKHLARSVGESIMLDTPAAAGGDTDDARSGYRMLDLIHYSAGSHTSWVGRV